MPEPKASIPKRILTNPKAQLVLLLVTIIYVISPIDIIPDVAFPVGYIDDVVVFLTDIISIIYFLKQKRSEFEKNAK